MYTRLRETATLIVGVFLVLIGSMLVFTPSIVNAVPPTQHDPFSDSECLACHTDQQRLQEITNQNETDEPEESSLSSGPG